MLCNIDETSSKVKGEQVLTRQIAQQLKTKNINVEYQVNYFVLSVKLNFCQRQTGCIDDQEKFQPVIDTYNECETPRKKLQSVLYFNCQLTRIYKNFKERYFRINKVQVDCLKDSESDSYYKNDMKEKVNDFVRLHEAMQEKLKTGPQSEQIQILTLVSDKWSRMYCSECFNASEYLA